MFWKECSGRDDSRVEIASSENGKINYGPISVL
jgi:hypothetical protein